MTISHAKQVAFLEKLISNVSISDSAWHKVSADSSAAHTVFKNEQLDREGIYSFYIPPSYKGEFWLARCQNGTVLGAIGSDMYTMEPFDSADAKIGFLLTKLFYRLFSQSPCAEQLVEDFLSIDE